MPNITEFALRAAVNSSINNSSSKDDPFNFIKSAALDKATQMVIGTATGQNVSSKISAQTSLIGAAVAVLAVGFELISNQADKMTQQRLTFDQERLAGIATFRIPVQKEESRLSHEELAIKSYLSLALNHTSFGQYLGIQNGTLLESKDHYYTLLPFYKMSEGLIQPISSPKPVDVQRAAIHLFFQAELTRVFKEADNDFVEDSKLFSFFSSTLQGDNYLNNRRAVRFIMMSLGNLIWNLQHLVDPKTGYPLTIPECLSICRDVEVFLNNLLDPNSPHYLNTIATEKNNLLSIIRKIELHVKGMRTAFLYELIHGLNIADIQSSGHRALRLMDKGVFKLIYSVYDPISDKPIPDDRAADKIAYSITYLNQLVNQNKDRLSIFDAYRWRVQSSTGLNPKTLTITDMLITFVHMTSKDIKQLFKDLSESPLENTKDFAKSLSEFYTYYIKPLKRISKKELHGPSEAEVALHTARRFVPMLTLLMEDYRLGNELEELKQRAKNYPGEVMLSPKQLQQINALAQQGTGYYQWQLYPLLVAQGSSPTEEFNHFQKHQYRITQITQLLDNLMGLITEYRHFLQSRSFQTFLLRCLNHIKKAYKDIDEDIEKLDVHISNDEGTNRRLSGILRPMLKELDTSIERFTQALSNFEKVVGAPDFPTNQKQLLAGKLLTINQQVSNLFKDSITVLETAVAREEIAIAQSPNPTIDEGIGTTEQPLSPQPALTAMTFNPSLLVSGNNKLPTNLVPFNAISELEQLINTSFQAMSSKSRQGIKGKQLTELLKTLRLKEQLTVDEFKIFTLELARIVSMARKNGIGTAAYAMTRSSAPLFAAIKQNRNSAITAAIFDQSIEKVPLDKNVLQLRLLHLSEERKWERSFAP